MTVSDDFDHEPADYDEWVRRLVQALAEDARKQAGHLLEHGFEMIEVSGLDRVIWKRDGRYYAAEAAEVEIQAPLDAAVDVALEKAISKMEAELAALDASEAEGEEEREDQ